MRATKIFRVLVMLAAFATANVARAETVTVAQAHVVEWKAVYGQVDTRERVPARARIGGTIVDLSVTEGDQVDAGPLLAVIVDDKIQFQLDSVDSRLEALGAQLETATAELERGQALIERRVITTQRLEQLQTAVDVISGEIRSLEAERLVVEQQVTEGEVRSPSDGVVLLVPVSLGSVMSPGETIAVVAGGGVYLRLSVPERHAGDLVEGADIEIGTESAEPEQRQTGRLVKLYPQIEGGRVQADVEVDGLDGRFVGRRVPVRLPVGERTAILVPETALIRHGGLDFVAVETAKGETRHRTVVPGGRVLQDGEVWREVLTGLVAGERVVLGHE